MSRQSTHVRKTGSKQPVVRRSRPPEEVIPHDLIEAIPDMCFVVSENGMIAQTNDCAKGIFGSSKKPLNDTMFVSLLDETRQQGLPALLSRCFNDQASQSHESEFRLPGGGTLPVVLQVSYLSSFSNKKNQYCFIVGHDISERKEKELDLLRFSKLAHFTVNPVEITGPDGLITYVNPAFEKASGYKKEEVLGKNPNIFGSGKQPKSFWQKMWKTINAGKVWTGEIENKRRNGDPFITYLLISPIVDDSGKVIGYFGIHRDITEQKHLEHQLVHAQKMESIGLLAAGIAHEVGNPLTSISSVVQVIQRSTKDEFTQEKLELIKSQIARISRIIRDLVNFSRRTSYEVQLTDVNKKVHESVEIVRVGRKAKDIMFNVKLEPEIPHLPLVPDQMEQVFINILINAVDAIHERIALQGSQGINIKPGEVIVKSYLDVDSVVVTVQDNGRGVSEEALPKIFEAFYTTKKVGEGTGLGLWVSYGIIKSFQGTITVKSKESEGTTFSIILPIHPELMQE